MEWNPDMSAAPRSQRLLAVVEGETRVIAWGKTSHVPLYGWCLADQGAEDFDLCEPTAWMLMPAPPQSIVISDVVVSNESVGVFYRVTHDFTIREEPSHD